MSEKPERLWSYTELKFIKVNENNCSSEELAEKVNEKFHKGEKARTAADMDRIKGSRNIFNHKRAK